MIHYVVQWYAILLSPIDLTTAITLQEEHICHVADVEYAPHY